MRGFGYEVTDLLVDHFETLGGRAVGARLAAQDVARLPLEKGPPEQGSNPSELLAHLKREVFPNNLHVDHPRFFAFVPGPGNFVSTMADALASGFNVFVGTWLGGSAAAAMELRVIEWLRRFCGLPETAGGLLTSGRSAANLIGLRAKPGWEILSPAQMAVVCFRFGREEAHQGRIVDAMLRDGYAFLTSTKIKGAACLRLCTINPRTTEAEMIETVDRLDECARKCL